MKVGTDGVLLGAWAAVRPQDRRMLDIGTGTGLIALMLAQRAPEAHVTGVDIDDVGQARENAAASPWSGRVAFAQCPVQEFETPEPFDLIVSNPPFFVDSLTCPDRGRTRASRPAKRALMEFVRADRPADRSADCSAAAPEVSELVVGTGEHECYTPEYRALTRDFYLKF